MRINLLSLSLAALGLASIDAAVQNVYIDPSKDLVCLILPPKGQIIGNTQTIGQAHCTNGSGDNLLPQDFFVSKQFLTTSTYVQAWGIMNDAAVGMLTSDGGGQYDIHADSGDNRAPGWAVFVELLEPNTGRWCIRFCHALGTDCNMGNSDGGCEGALKITDWPAATAPASGSASNSTMTKAAGSAATGTKAAATASGTNVNASSGTASAPTSSSTVPATGKTSSASSMFSSAKAPLAVMALSFAALFL